MLIFMLSLVSCKMNKIEKSVCMFYYLSLTTIIVLIDQFTKYLTVQNIALHETIEFIPGFMSFTYLQNSGAAWSILEGQMWFFYIVTVITVIAILYFLKTEGKTDKIFGTILTLVLGGTIGNFIDRLLYKYVIDMIRVEFISFPVFNVADSFLTVGVIALFIYTFYQEKKSGKI